MKFSFFLISFLSVFSRFYANESNQIGRKLVYSFAAKESYVKDWKLESYGGDFDGKIKKLYLGFQVSKTLGVDQSRKEVLESIQAFLTFINQNEENRNYFMDFPITEKNLKFSVSYVDDLGLLLEDDNLCYVSLMNSKLSYSKNGEKKLENIHRETFDEALGIVRMNENQKYLKISKEE